MWTSYFKMLLRTMRRRKGVTFINVAGLAVGMAACLAITLYIRDELSYDRFHADADRIYRINEDLKTGSETLHQGASAAPMGPAMVEDLPEVESFLRIRYVGPAQFQRRDGSFVEAFAILADSNLFDLFSFELSSGNPQKVLNRPGDMVLTRTLARNYFGDEDPLGKVITFQGVDLTVTGIMEDVPHNSHLQFDAVVSLVTFFSNDPQEETNWGNNNHHTFVRLREGVTGAEVEAKLPGFIENRIGDWQRQIGFQYTLFLQPLTDLYLANDAYNSAGGGSRDSLYVFGVVAVFILIIACINFMNLSTARSLERAREVGLRKVVGAARRQLIVQFLGESILHSVIALFIAIGLLFILRQPFESLAGKPLFLEGTGANYVFLLLGLTILVGLFAGSYPALVLSRFHPASVLKGTFGVPGRGNRFRKVLIVLQFCISIALISGTGIVYQQLQYVRSQNLGFDKEQMLIVPTVWDRQVRNQFETIKQEFARLPGVHGVVTSASVPGSGHSNAYTEIEVEPGRMQIAALDLYLLDFGYLEQYGVEPVAGRLFSRDFASDSASGLILNETAVRHLGYASPEDALGKKYKQWGSEGEIIGVIRDFHYIPLQAAIEALTMRIDRRAIGYFSVRLAPGEIHHTVAELENTWKRLVPHVPFNYYFLDEFFDQQYRAENQFGRIVGTFAALAIFVACLGLFGLASFMTSQRTKEIGVRKALGASSTGIVALISKDFVRLVLLALVVAIPVAYLAMSKWLEHFAYHMQIGPGVFVIAGVLALGIAFLTVSYQSIRAARANPSQALRYE